MNGHKRAAHKKKKEKLLTWLIFKSEHLPAFSKFDFLNVKMSILYKLDTFMLILQYLELLVRQIQIFLS